MATTIDILGCKAVVENPVGGRALDPCNCSLYYEVATTPNPSRTSLECAADLLWNHVNHTCDPVATVIGDGLCDPQRPWDRCLGASESFKSQMKRTCIDEGSFQPAAMGMTEKDVATTLSPRQQSANMELVLAAMVAGCVITLMLVTIIRTFCPAPRLPYKLQKLLAARSRVKLRKKPSTRREAVTEGDHISVSYEDIDDVAIDDNPNASPQSAAIIHTSPITVTTNSHPPMLTVKPRTSLHTSPPPLVPMGTRGGGTVGTKISQRPPQKAPRRRTDAVATTPAVVPPPTSPRTPSPRLAVSMSPAQTPARSSLPGDQGYVAPVKDSRPQKPIALPRKVSMQTEDVYLRPTN